MSLQQFKDDLAFSIYSMTVDQAHAKGICIECKKPPVFDTEMGPAEYNISGLCDPCWDAMFGEEEE